MKRSVLVVPVVSAVAPNNVPGRKPAQPRVGLARILGRARTSVPSAAPGGDRGKA